MHAYTYNNHTMYIQGNTAGSLHMHHDIFKLLYSRKFSFGPLYFFYYFFFFIRCYQGRSKINNFHLEFCTCALQYTSNKGVLWREILIEPAVIAAHHRINEEAADAAFFTVYRPVTLAVMCCSCTDRRSLGVASLPK